MSCSTDWHTSQLKVEQEGDDIGDIEALSDAYLSIISDGEYAKYLGINGYIKARANFGWDIVAGKMLQFIFEI